MSFLMIPDDQDDPEETTQDAPTPLWPITPSPEKYSSNLPRIDSAYLSKFSEHLPYKGFQLLIILTDQEIDFDAPCLTTLTHPVESRRFQPTPPPTPQKQKRTRPSIFDSDSSSEGSSQSGIENPFHIADPHTASSYTLPNRSTQYVQSRYITTIGERRTRRGTKAVDYSEVCAFPRAVSQDADYSCRVMSAKILITVIRSIGTLYMKERHLRYKSLHHH
jgi:hypothetical protein